MGLTLLALDTSTEACSVALLWQSKILHHFFVSPRGHTQRILSLINETLSEAGCRLSQVDAVAFTRGPGSFTGIRIGIGIAEGLAFGADKPLISISTLETLAQGAYRYMAATHIVSAIDARMNEVYVGSYRYQRPGKWLVHSSEEVMAPVYVADKICLANDEKWFSAGSGFQTYANMLPTTIPSGILLPDAQDMIPLAKYAWHHHQLLAPDEIEPMYLRNKITWKKLPGRE